MLTKITPVILTYNEAPNIGRTLAQLKWAREIVVVDSFSTDTTEAICSQYNTVRLFKRAFDTHSNQWNYAIQETGITTEWILSLDADYFVSDELREEIRNLWPTEGTNAYFARFNFAINGKVLSGSLYPPIAVLFRNNFSSYVQDGHTQRLKVEGTAQFLRSAIILDDRKPLSQWIAAQSKYAKLEADKISKSRYSTLCWTDRLRKCIFFAPWAIFMYTLFYKKAILSGWHGIFYSFQRLAFEVVLSLYLLEKKVTKP